MPESSLKILVVDDSALYRKIIKETLLALPRIDVVGSAPNGRIALVKTALLHPDLLTLDIEMPELNGLEVLKALSAFPKRPGVIVLSAYTTESAKVTLKALDFGAFDFIAKPLKSSLEENKALLGDLLRPMVEAFRRIKRVRKILGGTGSPAEGRRASGEAAMPREMAVSTYRAGGHFPPKIQAVAIGVSTGGPVALGDVIPRLPADIGVPIFIVQHMPSMFTGVLARKLDSQSQMNVKEAENGEIVRADTAYIAPGGKQMSVSKSMEGRWAIRITNDPPENNCKPSVDVLYRSIAESYGGNAVGVIMTGMGADGTEGLKMMKAAGAVVIAQDEATSVVYSMPKHPVEAGVVDIIAPLGRIADQLVRIVKGSVQRI